MTNQKAASIQRNPNTQPKFLVGGDVAEKVGESPKKVVRYFFLEGARGGNRTNMQLKQSQQE